MLPKIPIEDRSWGLGVDGGTAETEWIGLLVTLAAIAIVVIAAWWQRRRKPRE
ncbi:hypothetical protein [Bradyrhizobium betae]|uniref:hypothetical protein n=1 Tax=Bradyrhizobium betae TaxID=244734 RepID=UPI0012B6AA3F|nr:hypothetical protein [Bradyrhizobium betae]MCS3725932.1 hypothetical protein [Bradyrhizobium betae]